MSTSKVIKSSLYKSAGLVSAATALSRVFGLIREQVMAYLFGASMATDAFVVAFRVPNLLRDMFAEGALSSAFVPVFKEKLVNQDDQEAFRLAHVVLTAVLLVVGSLVLLGMIATPAIIFVTAKGFAADAAKFDLTVSLTRLMFVYLLLVSLSAAIMGMLNSFGRFGIPAMSPACFNIGIIVTVLLAYRYMEPPIYAMALGVLIGGVAQMAVQLPSLVRIGYRFKPRLTFLDEGFKKVVRLFVPMIVGMSAGRINILVNTLLASFLIEGAISYLNYSFRLMHFPLGVFAVALGTVALPSASEHAARGDMAGLAKTFREAISLNMLLIVPSALILAVWGKEIVALIYQWGVFSERETANTALALMHYSYGLIGFAAVRVTVPVFYALGDSRLPMKVSIASVVLNMLLYIPLINYLDFAGLAAATSIASLVNFGLLLFFLPRRGVPVDFRGLSLNFFRIVLAALIAMVGVRFVPYDFAAGQSAVVGRMLNLLVPVGVGLVVYVVLCLVLRVREISIIKQAIFRRRQGEAQE